MADCGDQLTCFALLKFFRRNGKDSEHLHHDLYDRVCHSRCRRDLDIRLEPMKETLDTLKDVCKGVLAGSFCLSCLRNLDVTMSTTGEKELREMLTERRIPIPVNIIPTGGYTCITVSECVIWSTLS